MRTIAFVGFILLLFSCQDQRSASDEPNLKEELQEINKNTEQDIIQDANLPNVIELIAANDALNIFIEALMVAEMIETLQSEGPYTVFAPTDAAFEAMGEERLDELMRSQNQDILIKLVSKHVHDGSWKRPNGEAVLKTINAFELQFTPGDTSASINSSLILSPEINASNGLVYIIDKVLE